MAASRYSFPIPFGWFHICLEATLEPGELTQMRRFERDLLVWRAEDGEYHVQDVFCPHLGANIAKGGEVVGNTVRCPFHDWQFNGDGSVAAIPYAKNINKKACLRTYPSSNHYGVIMAWYHPHAIEPLYQLPEVPELESGDYIGPIVQDHTIKTCLQEMGENVVDIAHFTTVHHHPGAGSYDELDFKEYMIRMRSKQVFPSSKGDVEGRIDVDTYSLGWSIVRYQTLIDITMITSQAPIEKDVSLQVNHVYYKNPERSEQVDRIGQAFNKEVNRQLTEDQPMWENKIYLPNPNLCDGDGPIHKFRKWVTTFYVEEEQSDNVIASS